MANWRVLKNQKWMHWDNLRKFGRSRLVRSTVVVPVLGYVILFNAEFSEYFWLWFESPDSSSRPGRLYWLYFGFCSLALGSIIFGLRCPNEVQEHGSAFDFVAKQALITNVGDLDGMREKLAQRRCRQLLPNTGYTFEVAFGLEGPQDHDAPDDLYKIRSELNTYIDALDDVKRDDLMRDYFEMLKTNRPLSRRAAFLMYTVGSALIAVPTVHTFVQIVKNLIHESIGM